MTKAMIALLLAMLTWVGCLLLGAAFVRGVVILADFARHGLGT